MKSIDCLLIQPPYWRQGILPHSDRHTAGEGILSIATFLKTNGFTVNVLFADEFFLGRPSDRGRDSFPYEKVKQHVENLSPRIVGIGPLTCQYLLSLRILKLCKEINPNMTTLLGGPHVTFLDRECFRDSEDVDVVVRGEGEWTTLDVVRHILEGRELDDVRGITFKKGNSIISNKNRDLGDLESLPPVDYSLVNPEYMRKSNFFFTFARGCPFKCAYCVERKFWGPRMRIRKVEAIKKEIKYLVSNYSEEETYIAFLASVFNIPESFFISMCGELKKIDFGDHVVTVLASANYLPENHLELMKEAGITRILIAVESVSEKVLKMMNKKISFNLVVEKCKLAKKYGIEVGTFWLFGHPGETPETARESLEAMVYLWQNDLNVTQEVSIFNPYPGTVFYENPERYGLKILTDNWEKYSRFDKGFISLDQFPNEKLNVYFDEARKIANFWPSLRRYLDLKTGSVHASDSIHK